MTESRTRYGQALIVLLGVFSFATILAFHNITDGDLWAKLAIGSSVWEQGHLVRHDLFAFTAVLPEYIDHEWGAGVIFYGLLKCFGPSSLMVLKMVLALSALFFGFLVGVRNGVAKNLLLLLAIPAAAALLPGYIPVLRSHAFTFCFFGLTLLNLDALSKGERWPMAILPLIILVWTNVHGGFVVGLAAIAIYALEAIINRRHVRSMIGTVAACLAVTLINPYGLKFWEYLIPALLHPRARILEWRPLPMFAWDDFVGFRVLFVLTLLALIFGWRRVSSHKIGGLAVLALTAFMGWRSRRHGPFFGVAALAFAGPYFAAALRRPIWSVRLVGAAYVAIAFYVSMQILPAASMRPWSPIGEDPVREADILSRAGARGNLATPFAWGSYLTWRLYPALKVSMDGRYETTYPEATFNLNADFFDRGNNWLVLVQRYKVDYVILDLHDRLQPRDLIAQGYVLIWQQNGLSALLCLPEHAAALQDAVRTLPDTTIDPLELVPWPPK